MGEENENITRQAGRVKSQDWLRSQLRTPAKDELLVLFNAWAGAQKLPFFACSSY
jgi:hypothetical protein